MGYFSRLAVSIIERKELEREPEKTQRGRLVNRISDLMERLDYFNGALTGSEYATYEVFPDRSLQHPILRYVLPEDLLSYDEVHSALLLAEQDLLRMDRKQIASVAFLVPGQMMIRSVVKR